MMCLEDEYKILFKVRLPAKNDWNAQWPKDVLLQTYLLLILNKTLAEIWIIWNLKSFQSDFGLLGLPTPDHRLPLSKQKPAASCNSDRSFFLTERRKGTYIFFLQYLDQICGMFKHSMHGRMWWKACGFTLTIIVIILSKQIVKGKLQCTLFRSYFREPTSKAPFWGMYHVFDAIKVTY